MKIKESSSLHTRKKITLGTKEWADYNVNCIIGCYNNCKYCYAKLMAKRFRRISENRWKTMKIRQDILRKNLKKRHGRVMFPSTHDIFDISPFKEACFIVLDKLLKSGNEVLITTKPKLAVIQEICYQFSSFRDKMQFRFTITSINNDLLKFWEPNASTFQERLKSLEYAWKSGFKTSVSIEPFLDYDPTELVKTVTPFVTESIWIGRMNYIPRQNFNKEEKTYYEEIRKNYETDHLLVMYHKLSRHPKIRFKDSIRIQLSRVISSI